MKRPSHTNKNLVCYRRYRLFESHEYIVIVGNSVWSSINPRTGICVEGGIKLTTKEDLIKVTSKICLFDEKPYVILEQSQRYIFDGYNYHRALNLLR